MKTTTFRPQQTLLLIRNLFVVNRNIDLISILIGYALLLHLMIVNRDDLSDEFISLQVFLYFILYVSIILPRFSRVYGTTSHPRTLTAYYMLPASLTEKFVAHLCYATLASVCVFTLPIVLSEVTRLSVLPYFLVHTGPATFMPALAPDTFFTAWPYLPTVVLIGVWSPTLFLLGGYIFRKGAFAKVLAIQVGLGLLVFIGYRIAGSLYCDLYDRTLHWSDEAFYVLHALLLILTGLNLVLAYRLHNRKPIIKSN